MNRDKLIAQVKDEYTRIASSESQQNFLQTTANLTPGAYYEKLLGKAITEINKGTFDNCNSGEDVVTAIANDKSWHSDLN